MFEDRKLVVLMPRLRQRQTLPSIYDKVKAQSLVGLMILVDDARHDETVAIGKRMNQLKLHIQKKNLASLLSILVMVLSNLRCKE